MEINDTNTRRITTRSLHLRVPIEVEEVQKELAYHPALLAELSAPGAVKTFEDGVAIIATYCDVVLHGEYTEVGELFGMLLQKLRDKRGAIAIII